MCLVCSLFFPTFIFTTFSCFAKERLISKPSEMFTMVQLAQFESAKLLRVSAVTVKMALMGNIKRAVSHFIQCYSKCDHPWMISISWEFVRQANFQLHPRPAESESLQGGTKKSVLTSFQMTQVC